MKPTVGILKKCLALLQLKGRFNLQDPVFNKQIFVVQ